MTMYNRVSDQFRSFLGLLVSILLTMFLFPTHSFSQVGQSSVENSAETGNKVALRINPSGFVYGTSSLGIDFQVAPKATIGLQLSFVKLNQANIDMTSDSSYGARFQYFFTQVYRDSWYLAMAFDVINGVLRESTSPAEIKTDGFSSEILVGYFWAWESSFFTQVAGGARAMEFEERSALASTTVDEINGIYPAFEVGLGMTF